jgi:hypothetical protein
MNKVIIILIALSLLPAAAGGAEVEVIWASQKGGPSSEWIDALDINDGHRVDSFDIPDRCHYGITWDTTYWWGGNLYDNLARRFDDNENVISSFTSPNGEDVYGIAYDGSDLWLNCFNEAYHVDFNGVVIPPNPFTMTGCVDIAWDGAYLWAVEYPDMIHRYNVNTGVNDISSPLPSADHYSYGITSDGIYLYISGSSPVQEPYTVIWIYNKSGNYVGQIDNPEWGWSPAGLAYGTTEVNIKSASLGEIKAYFK